MPHLVRDRKNNPLARAIYAVKNSGSEKLFDQSEKRRAKKRGQARIISKNLNKKRGAQQASPNLSFVLNTASLI